MELKAEKVLKFDTIKLKEAVYNMGSIDVTLDQIYSPIYDDDDIGEYIHEQFLEDANTYIDKYSASSYWEGLISEALAHIKIRKNAKLKILDIGSGGGNTIFPMIDLFPNSMIIASDLSVPLLKHLKNYKDKHYSKSNCHVLQLNAEQMIFEPNQFDLIIGGAILHHLFDPEKVIAEVQKALKPGGSCIFYEPFENGNLLITLLMKLFKQLNEHKTDKIPDNVIDFFNRLIYDFQVRKGQDKSDNLFKEIDDKWLFTKSYFETIKKKYNFEELIVFPVIPTVNMFRQQFATYLRLGADFDYNQMPKWTKKIIEEQDNHFSEDSKMDLLIEGTIILKK